MVIVFILKAFGVDTTEILAGLGILTLIIGLGVTSLIEDIVAGIFIIAEGLFDVGDVVVINGFRVPRNMQAAASRNIIIIRNSSI